MRDLILQLSKSSIYSTKPRDVKRVTLEAIPPKNTDKHMWIGFNLSQDLPNGIKNISVAHTAFRELDFKVLNTRRVMLEVKRADGS